MLTLVAEEPCGEEQECLLDAALPIEVRELPKDALPVGFRPLLTEDRESIHVRRFCRISLADPVPNESTVRSSHAG